MPSSDVGFARILSLAENLLKTQIESTPNNGGLFHGGLFRLWLNLQLGRPILAPQKLAVLVGRRQSRRSREVSGHRTIDWPVGRPIKKSKPKLLLVFGTKGAIFVRRWIRIQNLYAVLKRHFESQAVWRGGRLRCPFAIRRRCPRWLGQRICRAGQRRNLRQRPIR